MYYQEEGMSRAKIAITLEEKFLDELDRLVRERVFQNRSQAIQLAVEEMLQRLQRQRLAQECARLDPVEEKLLAEEGLTEDLSGWPAY
jgi:Arc/MetJ-type ribon-helix-helix transcriptional regulator